MSQPDPNLPDRSQDRSEHAAPPPDGLDGLLRQWHAANRERADAGRARLVSALAIVDEQRALPREPGRRSLVLAFRGALLHRHVRAAACLALLAGLFALIIPFADRPASADGIAMVPDGGRLEALDAQGQLVGPCPLKHTDVKVNIGAHFSRVNVTQTFTNPYPFKVEAVYTFPLSHRAAVDRMTMTVGDRVIVGEVKERRKARQIYEAARESGYVASLLEQERPNIFTQSIANLEPGATIEVSIGYVETLQSRDGEFRFDFPMVVGPRYIPGYPGGAPQPVPGIPALPAQFQPRHGLTLLGPAAIELVDGASAAGGSGGPAPSPADLDRRLGRAVPIATPGEAWWNEARAGTVARTSAFRVIYADGSRETGELHSDGTAVINGRWVWCPPRAVLDELPGARPAAPDGLGFAPDTDQVPDASRITPMPVRPPARAGHDVSLTVTVDSGGPALRDVHSVLHEVAEAGDGPSRRTLTLKRRNEIPNRDFILTWRTEATEVAEAVLTDVDERHGGFVTVVLNPPPRVADSQVRPRELVFVLDTSGSMSGFPIEKAKAVMAKAIEAMRPGDTFNLITFAGETKILWPQPRPATAENQREAQAFLAGRSGGGGTEMMTAINAALRPTGGEDLDPMALANLPADGRSVTVVVSYSMIEQRDGRRALRVSEGIVLPLIMGLDLPTVLQPEGVKVRLTGAWKTVHGERHLEVRDAGFVERGAAPMRICMFLTDGFVGNDQAIVAAVRQNAGNTRVFSFGIGNSVNRWLIDELAAAGRGASEVVTLAEESDPAVERFTQRIRNPVLTDIAVRIEGAELVDLVPGTPTSAPGLLPDLYDREPLALHARYRPLAATERPRSATLVITGNAGSGPWERRVPLVLRNAPATETVRLDGRELAAPVGNDALPVLWARSRVDQVLAPHLQAVQEERLDPAVRQQIVALGETFSIMTPFTSFVAVERARVTLGGRATLVPVPIELPEGLRWEGFFADRPRTPWREVLAKRLAEDPTAGSYLYFGLDDSGLAGRQIDVLADALRVSGAGRDSGMFLALSSDLSSDPSSNLASGVPNSAPRQASPSAAQAPPDSAAAPAASAAPPAAKPAGEAPAKADRAVARRGAERGEGGSPPAPSMLGGGLSGGVPAPTAVHAAMPVTPAGDAKDRGTTGAARPSAPIAGSGGPAPSTSAPVVASSPPPPPQVPAPVTTAGQAIAAGAGPSGSPASPQGGTGANGPAPVASGSDPRAGGASAPPGAPPMGAGGGGAATPPPTLGSVGSAVPAVAPSVERLGRLVEPGQPGGLAGEALVLRVQPGLGDVPDGGASGGAAGSVEILEASLREQLGLGWVLRGETPSQPVAGGSLGGAVPDDPDLRAAAIGRVVAVLVSPELWTSRGGGILDGRVEHGRFVVSAAAGATESDEARQAIRQASALRDAVEAALGAAPSAGAPPAGSDSVALTAIPADARGATVVLHQVGDLVRTGSPTAFADFLSSFVEPSRWTHRGGADASMSILGGVLAVRAPAPMQAQLAALLRHMRQASAAGGSGRVQADGLLIRDVGPIADRCGPLLLQAVWLVEPASWRVRGGSEGLAWPIGRVLVVQHRPEVLEAVERVLDQIQLALGLAVPGEAGAAAAEAQRLGEDDGRRRIVVHAVDDLVVAAAAAAAAGGTSAPTRGWAIGQAALDQLAGEAGASGQPVSAASLAEFVVVDATPAQHARLDRIFQEMRSEFGLPARPLARTAQAEATEKQATAAESARRARLEALHRRLEERLFARIVEREDPTRTLVDRARLEEELAGRAVADGDVLAVSVLVDEASAARVRELRSAGLSVEGRNDRLKVVAGWIPAERLAELALAEGVRRVSLVGE